MTECAALGENALQPCSSLAALPVTFGDVLAQQRVAIMPVPASIHVDRGFRTYMFYKRGYK